MLSFFKEKQRKNYYQTLEDTPDELEGRFSYLVLIRVHKMKNEWPELCITTIEHSESISFSMKNELEGGTLGKPRRNHLFFPGTVST